MRKFHSTTALALVALAGATAANAQAQDRFAFDLPAETLSQALRDVALRTGRNLIAPAELVGARQAEPLSGTFTAEEAVTRLLSGTGLRYRLVEGTLIVERVPFAETAAGTPDGPDTAITVTGTRIRGAGSTSPVIVATRRALEQQGVTDLAGYTRILPQNFTGGQNPGIAGGGQQGGQSNTNNSADLNLRGLGPDATLTLFNGHRLAYDALAQGIDLSAIPLSAIERIEVIADGASALYGSEAVAGVANIILRRDYDGLEASARVGGSTDGGNFQQDYGLVGGRRWSSGGFMLALDYNHATPILGEQRAYTRDLPTLTLAQRNRQSSAVFSGHQQISGAISLDLDGYAMRRESLKQSPFLPPQSVFTNGNVSRQQVRSYAFTPTLRVELPHGWQSTVSYTRAESRTRLHTTRYVAGNGADSFLMYDNLLSGAEATAEGPLLSLPGGPARLAVGGGLRKVRLHDNITDIIGGRPVPFRDFTESRQVQFAYGELSLPLIGPDQRLPLIERLTLSGALRYERWKGIDSVATPKLGLVYEPLPDVTIRATWGRSFKAPTLNQVHQAPQGFLLPGFFFTQPTPPLAPGATVLLLGGGNLDLRSERAATWSASVDVRPRLLDGLQLEATWFNIDYRGRVVAPVTGTLGALANPIFRDLITFNPSVDEVNALIATFPEGLSNQTGQPFNPANVGAIIDDSLLNAASQHIRGLDLLAQYGWDLRAGQRLSLDAAASYLKSNQRLSANQPTTQLAGTIFNPPHWRGRLGATWQGPRAGLSAFVNYIGSTLDTRFTARERVSQFVTLDVSGSIRTAPSSGLLGGLELRLSALNLLDEKPAIVRVSSPEAPPYDSVNQSPVGRFIGLSVRKTW